MYLNFYPAFEGHNFAAEGKLKSSEDGQDSILQKIDVLANLRCSIRVKRSQLFVA
ncbi:MAG: hypothetical protein V7K40_32255 [Nostoc sp.]|uniref:hypothetical protein n=1 Tax=Nostoc sp. TaxID=1180 RepID=UPI002FF5E5B1